MNNQFDTEPGDEELNGISEELLTPEELITPEEFQDWGGSELEAAYLKALSALEASESEIKSENSAEASQQNLAEARLDPIPTSHSSTVNSNTVIRAPGTTGQSDASESANSLSTASLSELMEALPTPNSSRTHQKAAAATSVSDVPMTPRQIIEACLFVGGTALTSKRLCGVLRGDSQAEFVDHEINELNRLYAAENRPYEIRLVEGGYRLSLREEFERIRHKVYGLGPKEVRLSQEALEVLAVVADRKSVV